MTQPLGEQCWHCLPGAEVVQLLDGDEDKGLDRFEVGHRRERYGSNVLTRRGGPGRLKRFLLQFHAPLVYVLLGSAAVTLALRDWVDSAVILAVVLVNAAIGYLQEAKAVSAIAALQQTMSAEATVLRAGERLRLPAEEIVVGDIVLLASGDKVPADLRLLHTRELQINESALTGESLPVEKDARPLRQDTPLAERQNMAFASALVTYGQGTGVVVATGDSTEVGRISELIAEADVLATPLTRKIARFSGLLLWVILALGGVTFVTGLLRGESAVDMFKAAVALAVGAIPEGLPAAVTITLAIGVGRMASRRAVIRRLPAVETLGGTTVICTDKTGTLTENQMTVRAVVAGGRQYEATGGGYAPAGHLVPAEDGDAAQAFDGVPPPDHDADAWTSPTETDVALRETLLAGLLCNDSVLVEGDDGRCDVQGDPTEGALITVAAKGGLRRAAAEAQLPRVDAIPFESQHQFMATLHSVAGGEERVVYLKGAAEVLADRCPTMLDVAGHEVPIDLDFIHAEMARLAHRGLRVLAFARGHRPEGDADLSHDEVEKHLVFLGLQAMIDPPREEAVAAVRACREAGVAVRMITGDHAATASAIAAQIGLGPARAAGAGEAGEATTSPEGDGPDPQTLTGTALAGLSDDELIEAAAETHVFARVSPEQKLRLVEALQARGNVVAMTGDGVNDAPALKQADIGVAMGITGTEVAKDAADMVLTDDNFASIEAAVEEGRGVYDNLIKFITWTLPTNLGEGLVVLTAVFLGATLPILPLQILWINMTTAVLLGLMLAFEPKEAGIMRRPPRDPRQPILTRPIVERIVLVGAMLLAGAFGLFELALRAGASDDVARTVAVNVFVFVELFYLFNCRSLTRSPFALGLFTNRNLLLGVGGMVGLQLLYTYAPFMNVAFASAPVPGRYWVWILVVSVLAYGVVEVEKRLRARRHAAAVTG